MGLDFSYILYVRWEKMWDALQAVTRIALPATEPTRILFPDHEILVPMETWLGNNGVQHFDDPEIDFSTVLYFEEDEAILEYIKGDESTEELRSPPEPNGKRRIPIGYIYLSIRNKGSDWYAEDDPREWAAFCFGTPGTTMSILFEDSPSIRNTFLNLARVIPAECAVFDREFNGEVIWWQGHEISEQIEYPFMTPSEIRQQLIRSGKLPGFDYEWP